jgi:hypothetical protein
MLGKRSEKSETEMSTADRMIQGRSRKVMTSVGEVTLRQLDFEDLCILRGGLIDLASMIKDSKGDGAAWMDSMSPADARKFRETLNRVVEGVVVHPVLVEQTEPETVIGPRVGDFPVIDRLAIYSEASAMAGLTRRAAAAIRP